MRIYLLRSRAIRLPNRMESWQRFFHNKRKQNIQDEMFCPWPSNSSVNKKVDKINSRTFSYAARRKRTPVYRKAGVTESWYILRRLQTRHLGWNVLPMVYTIVNWPMLRCRPNRTKLRRMDSYIQILCRFQKCNQKVPPPSPLSNEKLKSFFFQNFHKIWI